MSGPIRQRLADLGIELPTAPRPIAAYAPAIRCAGLVFTAGQLPMMEGALRATGSVGVTPERAEGDQMVTPELARECARICAVNAIVAAASILSSVDDLARVVKVNVFVASAPGFTGQPGVGDGASDLPVAVFGDSGRHARSAVGVASLPLGAPVEVDVIFEAA